MLKESEWKMINNILLELYMTESIEDLASKFFKIIKTLIQYTSGYMLLLDKNKNIIINKTACFGLTMKIKKTPTAHPIKAPKIGINAVNAIKKVANPLAM